MSLSSVVRDSLLDGVCVSNKKIGGGTYGSVFLGSWNSCPVAVKKLHPTWMGLDEDDRPADAFVRFMKEFPVLERLAHPSIVNVFGMVPPSCQEGSYGLVMEFLPVTLQNRYEQEPQLTHGHEVSIMASLASGLQYLHHKGILHRDLTTSNVMMVERAGCENVPVRAKIIDAGVARVLSDVDVKEITMTLAPGAENYMAPEARTECQDQQAKYGRSSDVYGLGVTVMAMCNRREPPSLTSVVLNGRKSDLALMKGLSHPLYNVVSKCVEEDSSVRPTCLQLCEELAKLQLRYPAAVVSQKSGDGAASDGNATYTDDDVAPLRDQLYDVTIERDSFREENIQLRQEVEDKEQLVAQLTSELDTLSAKYDQLATEQHQQVQQKGTAADEVTRPSQLSSAQNLKTGQAHTSTRTIRSAKGKAPLNPEQQQVVDDSQLPPKRLKPSTPGQLQKDRGVLARYRRLFAVDGILPAGGKSPEWNVIDSPLPVGLLRTHGKPAYHGGYCYSLFVNPQSGISGFWGFDTPALFRYKVGSARDELWQPVTLPGGELPIISNSCLFSTPESLFVLLCESKTNLLVYRFLACSRWLCVTASIPGYMPCLESLSIAVFKSTLFLACRNGFWDSSNMVYKIDLEASTPQWTEFASLPCDFFEPSMVVQGDYLHVLPSYPKGSTSAEVLSIRATAEDQERIWHFNILPPVPAHFQFATVINGHLVVTCKRSATSILVHMYIPECNKYLLLSEAQLPQNAAPFGSQNALFMLEMSASKGDRFLRLHVLSM